MAEKRKRIAMVAYTFYPSDPRVRRHVANLVAGGYDVDVLVVRNPSSPHEACGEHVSFFFVRSRDYARQGRLNYVIEYAAFAAICSLILLRNHLFRSRYSLVHINNMPNFLLLAALPLRLLGVPILLDVHDAMPEIYQDKFGAGSFRWAIRLLRLEERICMRLADFVITAEHTKWQRLISNGLRREKSAVVLNLPDPGIFPQPELPEALSEPVGRGFRLVYHGTLARRLGVDVAIRAVHLLKDRIPQLRFDIIGDGEQRPDLVRLAAQLGLEEQVRFSPGFLPVEQLPGLLAGADIALIPSRNSISTGLMLPTKLLEYVRLGIACVTVATPTISFYFDAAMVRFFPPEDPSALAEQILDLYQRPQQRIRLAIEARKFYNEHGFEAQRDRYLELLRNLTRGRVGASL